MFEAKFECAQQQFITVQPITITVFHLIITWHFFYLLHVLGDDEYAGMKTCFLNNNWLKHNHKLGHIKFVSIAFPSSLQKSRPKLWLPDYL